MKGDDTLIWIVAGSDVLLAVTLPLGMEIYDLSKSATKATATIALADEGLIAASAFAGTVVEAAVDPSQVLAILQFCPPAASTIICCTPIHVASNVV